MSTDIEDQELLINAELDGDSLETNRLIIRRSLAEIANAVGTRMRIENLRFQVGLTVATSGPTLLSIITPVDPNDDDWLKVTEIVCQIVAERLPGTGLRSRSLPCVIANGTMTVAEITPNNLTFGTRL